MTDQETLLARKRRGPAPTGKGQQVVVRLQPDQLAALDRWIADHAPDTSRPEAVRKMLALSLAHEHWTGRGLNPVVVPLTGLERASVEDWAKGQPDSISLPEAALRLLLAGLER
ncbi:MAG: hypothetical protein KGL44_09085 [Sphingomonadales bacterium]|nr:hypothetical protein [Sphingomonadales bacterium]